MTDATKGESSLADKANADFRQAASKIVQRAKQTGTPLVVWEEGHVKEVSPDKVSELSKPAGEDSN